MLFRIAYNFVGPKNVLRSSALVIDGKDINDAKRKAEEQLRKTMETAFEISGAKPFGTP